MSPGIPVRHIATFVGTVLALVLLPQPAAAHGDDLELRVKENHSRVRVDGPGFVTKLTKNSLGTRVNDDEFGLPGTGNPIVRDTIDLTGVPLRPFECDNGTYTIQTGAFDRTFRASVTPAERPAPYTEEFNAALPEIFTPFVGELRGTVTDAGGETLNFLISDIVLEVVTEDGFISSAPIHGFFVDEDGRVRDRISLIGRFMSGHDGQDAEFWIEDRGTCRQRADLPYGPGSADAVVTGPLFVLPFSAPVRELGRR